MTREEMQTEAIRLNQMCDEVLSFNIQGGNAEDHILVAEAQLAFYEASMKIQLEIAPQEGISFEDEGVLAVFRHAANLHVEIAKALKS